MGELDVDEALAYLGRYSRWHILTYTFIAVAAAFPAAWATLNIVFIGVIPDYYCNVTDLRSIPVKVDGNETIREQCDVYTDWRKGNETQSCPNGYTYETDMESTIVMEWELVCDHEYLKDLSQTIFAVGIMIGAIVYTSLADRYGRKMVFLLSNVGMLISGTVMAFSPNYAVFAIVRLIMGTFQSGIFLVGFVLACELFPADLRTLVGTLVQCAWGLGMMFMALTAYFLRNWQYYQLSLALPGVFTLFGFWCMPESIPWLVANGRRKEAEAILKRAAKFNNVDMPSHVFEEESANFRDKINVALLGDVEEKSKTEPEEVIKESPMVFLTHAKLRNYTIIMVIAWFVNAIVYFGLSLSTGELAGDRYVNFCLSGTVEFFAYLLSVWVLERFGRRIPLCVYHFISAVGLILSVFVPTETADGTSLLWLVILLSMIGKFGISSSFSVIFLYAGEIIPVNVRGFGMGICAVGSQVGGIIAPFSSTMMRTLPWLPGVLFGGLSIAVGLLALLLPETLHRVLPQSVADLDLWDKKRGRAKSVDIHAMQRKSTRRRAADIPI